MKVISPGMHPGNPTLRGRCNRCYCVVECQLRECKVYLGSPLVICPTCGTDIYPAPMPDPKRYEVR